MDKQYAEREIDELDFAGGYYSRHVNAMTAENLNSKSQIAGELAYRDFTIDQLLEQINLLEAKVDNLEKENDSLGEDVHELMGERDELSFKLAGHAL